MTDRPAPPAPADCVLERSERKPLSKRLRFEVFKRDGFHAVYEAAEIALVGPCYGNRQFRYFCGVCWNKVRALEGRSA